MTRELTDEELLQDYRTEPVGCGVRRVGAVKILPMQTRGWRRAALTPSQRQTVTQL